MTAIEQYLKPFLIGRDPDDIEDIWQAAFVSSYWRGGPVLNNALSGVDQALWDIKGKRAGMPVYQLLGGKCPASGRCLRPRLRAGTWTRSRTGPRVHGAGLPLRALPGGRPRAGDLRPGQHRARGSGALDARTPEPRRLVGAHALLPSVPRCSSIRARLGDEVELLHDVHERIPPILAIQLAKELEPYHLFFLEDLFAPEDLDYFRLLRQQTSTPIAMGELFVNQAEYVPLVSDRLIDFIRVHISDIGGLTPARKLAAFCEFFGVRTAWHGPGDVSPVGHAANLHLDLASSNFGIQEAYLFRERTREVFPGCPEIRDGAMWTNDRPGLGIDIDEAQAARYPFPEHAYNGAWPEIRRADGAVIRP